MNDNTSGEGKFAKIPDEIKGWNWGAFFLTFLWGVYNKTYISLLCIIPLVTPVMAFVLGAKGNKLAWRNRLWFNIEHFKKIQKRWAIAGFIMFLIIISIIIFAFAYEGFLQLRTKSDIKTIEQLIEEGYLTE